ncbi:MAG TPA: tetratricopeptide repeat protein [Chthoniobacterales bacterium]|nr:tetratricopeptide repeat protein [Chthoniobacterales bacterium]
MRAVSFLQGSRSQQTFVAAMALLVAVAVAQILSALYLSTRHPGEAPSVASQNAAVARLFKQSLPAPSAAPVTVPAVEGVPQATVRRGQAPPSSVAETLLRVARGFRDRGDTTNAIAKLQQATALDPGNPEILAELALTYESMQLFDRSNEVWRRLQSLGPAVGPLYELAEVKLRVGVPAQSNALRANGSTAPPGAPPSDAAGIPDGSTFGISEVTLKTEPEPDAETKLLLRVGVKARPDTPIDHTKVKIQVFFYDTVNNDQVVLTNADVSYEWVTPGHDWADTGTEVLDVTYLRPKRNEPAPGTALANQPVEVPDSVEKAKLAARKPSPPALLPPSESGPRAYLGYIVRVYYQDQLQAVRAEPARLLNLFPPPVTAPPQ